MTNSTDTAAELEAHLEAARGTGDRATEARVILRAELRRIPELEARVAELEGGLAEMVDAANRQGERNLELAAELRELRTELRSARADYDQEHDSLVRARARIAELETEADGHSEHVAELEARAGDFEAELAAREARVRELERVAQEASLYSLSGFRGEVSPLRRALTAAGYRV